jgi:N,N-dimethylformamidase
MQPIPQDAEVFGYLDRFEYRPGERIDVHLHSTVPGLELDLVRLHGADERVTSALPLEREVEAVPSQAVRGEPRELRRGSFARISGLLELTEAASAAFEIHLFPTLSEGRTAVIISSIDAGGSAGFELVLLDGRPQLRLAGAAGMTVVCELEAPIPSRVWTELEVELDPAAGRYSIAAKSRLTEPRRTEGSGSGSVAALAGGTGTVTLAAGADGRRNYNGKLGRLLLRAAGPDGVEELIGRWNFGSMPESQRLVAEGPGAHHGELVRGPTRAVTGPGWRGDEVDWRLAPAEYDAVHFHEDDLDDAGWPVSAQVRLPTDLPSGIYAVRARGGGVADRIPFFVLPSATTARPKIAFLAPTFTYLAYGNVMIGDRLDYVAEGISDRPVEPGPRDRQLGAHPEFAGSLYDIHSDGSGRCYSSLRRPLFNFRADASSAIQQAFRHFGADLYLTGWLDQLDLPYDVITDLALHEGGEDLLEPYRVLITSSHPEYVSEPELTAIEAFLERGGRVMYLGGNGFYWVTAVDAGRPHLVEVRRGNAGTRSWDSQPGETHLSSTGEPGGLWRHRGRAPNALVGIGMASQGWDEKAPGYRRTEDGRAAGLEWLFEGIEGDRFGEEGLVMGGAAGDEVDRYDRSLGSPPGATVIATSTGHSRFYQLVHEDQLMATAGRGGDTEPDVRSDVVVFPVPGGGAVFSVGAIAWAGAMAVNDFDNPLARLTTNVLLRFLDPRPPIRGDGE